MVRQGLLQGKARQELARQLGNITRYLGVRTWCSYYVSDDSIQVGYAVRWWTTCCNISPSTLTSVEATDNSLGKKPTTTIVQ